MKWMLGGLALLAQVLGAPAQAEWRQARTDHFTLTIDDTEQGARDFASKLERFDAALRQLYGVADDADQHARPLSIYAMKLDAFNAACGCPNTLGYYRQRVEGSFILVAHVPEIDRKTKIGWWSSETLLRHEYSHHFMYANFPIAYPYWFQEGFAEFNANASYEADNSVIIGYPANYRAAGLKNGSRLSARQLFDPFIYGFPADRDLMYGHGWLLTNYLMLKPQRSEQLATYLVAMNKGQPSLAAAEGAFGNLKTLDAELDVYQRGQLGAPLRIPPAPRPIAVSVSTLSPGQARMLPVHALVMNGVGSGYAFGVALRAAQIAKRFPADAVVQAQWADAEFLAGRLDQADHAADEALKLDPGLLDALDRKGRIAIRKASDAKSADAAVWSAARGWFLKANRVNPDAVMPLYLYYASFVSAKAKPTAGALKGLMRAAVLAPESVEVRTALAREMLISGDTGAARSLLQPLAFAPHQQGKTNLSRDIVDLIDAGKFEDAKAAMLKTGDQTN